MKKFLIGLVILAGTSGCAQAQKFTDVNATEERWSGGVVGRYGVNYRISFKTNTNKIVFDSAYINNIGYSLTKPDDGIARVSLDSAKHAFTIYVTELHDRGIPGRLNQKEDKTNATVEHVRSFTGKALFVYMYKGKKHLFLVKEMSALPSKSYP